jgi:hypothetical protein
MYCPKCRLELSVERRAGELILTHSFKEWPADCCCRTRGDPALCCKLMPTILEMLPEGKGSERRERRA